MKVVDVLLAILILCAVLFVSICMGAMIGKGAVWSFQ